MTIKPILNFFNLLVSIKNLFYISTLNIENAFYSENKNYQKFSIPIIDLILKNSKEDVCYISSDIEDKIYDKKIKNIYIGNGIIKNIFFLVIKSKNLFLTLTDLNNHFLKKTKKIEKYIYFFHSPISTFKSYTSSAFDNYDVILCNGYYQKKEIRHREVMADLKKKELVEFGYIYFNSLKYTLRKKNFSKNEEILIAPSWNVNEKNFISEKIIFLIEKLLTLKNKIRFRPHPEHFKRSKSVLNKIKEKFINQDFIFDQDPDPSNALRNSKYLITDTSGIALEYLLIFKKPVIYLETKDKVHNKKIEQFSGFTAIEDEIKSKFGLILDFHSLDNIEDKINVFIKNFKNPESDIDNFLIKNFYNIEKNEIAFIEKLKNIID